ncbi:MAG: glycoside hydrolase family 3 protein [Phycisphaerae bacterium]
MTDLYAHSDRVKKIADEMTLEQLVGQTLVLGWTGAFPHRDVLESVEKYHPAGFRITPHGRKFGGYAQPGTELYDKLCREPEPYERVYHTKAGEPRLTVAHYAEARNVVRRRSLETGAGIPCYFAHDQEGNTQSDTLDRHMVAFPHPMGIAQGGPELCRQVGRVVGRQLKSAGVDLTHGPVVDVNTDPHNPEISSRSYSPFPEVVGDCALQTMLGFHENGLIATAKHFPGRGASNTDAHFSVPVIDESRERMEQIHLAPYRRLIAEGLPAIMLAHSIYPALDPSEEISTVSRAIVTDLLREQMGFEGVVMTDSFTMAGLVMKYDVAEGVVRSIEAGVDLILLKDENALRGEAFGAIRDAVTQGRLSEERLRQSVLRTLTMKERFGMLDEPFAMTDVDRMRKVHADPEHRTIADTAAQKAVVCLRRQEGVFPFAEGKKVLVVEEPFGFMAEQNNELAYCGSLYHALLERGIDAHFTDYTTPDLDAAWDDIERLAALVDALVVTCHVRRGRQGPQDNTARFQSLGKPVVFVGNNPYPRLVPENMQNVLVTFNTTARTMRMVADVLTGRRQAGELAFDPTRVY